MLIEKYNIRGQSISSISQSSMEISFRLNIIIGIMCFIILGLSINAGAERMLISVTDEMGDEIKGARFKMYDNSPRGWEHTVIERKLENPITKKKYNIDDVAIDYNPVNYPYPDDTPPNLAHTPQDLLEKFPDHYDDTKEMIIKIYIQNDETKQYWTPSGYQTPIKGEEIGYFEMKASDMTRPVSVPTGRFRVMAQTAIQIDETETYLTGVKCNEYTNQPTTYDSELSKIPIYGEDEDGSYEIIEIKSFFCGGGWSTEPHPGEAYYWIRKIYTYYTVGQSLTYVDEGEDNENPDKVFIPLLVSANALRQQLADESLDPLNPDMTQKYSFPDRDFTEAVQVETACASLSESLSHTLGQVLADTPLQMAGNMSGLVFSPVINIVMHDVKGDDIKESDLLVESLTEAGAAMIAFSAKAAVAGPVAWKVTVAIGVAVFAKLVIEDIIEILDLSNAIDLLGNAAYDDLSMTLYRNDNDDITHIMIKCLGETILNPQIYQEFPNVEPSTQRICSRSNNLDCICSPNYPVLHTISDPPSFTNDYNGVNDMPKPKIRTSHPFGGKYRRIQGVLPNDAIKGPSDDEDWVVNLNGHTYTIYVDIDNVPMVLSGQFAFSHEPSISSIYIMNEDGSVLQDDELSKDILIKIWNSVKFTSLNFDTFPDNGIYGGDIAMAHMQISSADDARGYRYDYDGNRYIAYVPNYVSGVYQGNKWWFDKYIYRTDSSVNSLDNFKWRKKIYKDVLWDILFQHDLYNELQGLSQEEIILKKLLDKAGVDTNVKEEIQEGKSELVRIDINKLITQLNSARSLQAWQDFRWENSQNICNISDDYSWSETLKNIAGLLSFWSNENRIFGDTLKFIFLQSISSFALAEERLYALTSFAEPFPGSTLDRAFTDGIYEVNRDLRNGCDKNNLRAEYFDSLKNIIADAKQGNRLFALNHTSLMEEINKRLLESDPDFVKLVLPYNISNDTRGYHEKINNDTDWPQKASIAATLQRALVDDNSYWALKNIQRRYNSGNSITFSQNPTPLTLLNVNYYLSHYFYSFYYPAIYYSSLVQGPDKLDINDLATCYDDHRVPWLQQNQFSWMYELDFDKIGYDPNLGASFYSTIIEGRLATTKAQYINSSFPYYLAKDDYPWLFLMLRTCYEFDTDCDACMSLQELNIVRDRWFKNSSDVTMPELIGAIKKWKESGSGSCE